MNLIENSEDVLNNIELSSLQRAKKKYYEKIKTTDEYKQKRREISKKQYEQRKHDVDFIEKVKINKKNYYHRKKLERLLEINLLQ